MLKRVARREFWGKLAAAALACMFLAAADLAEAANNPPAAGARRRAPADRPDAPRLRPWRPALQRPADPAPQPLRHGRDRHRRRSRATRLRQEEHHARHGSARQAGLRQALRRFSHDRAGGRLRLLLLLRPRRRRRGIGHELSPLRRPEEPLLLYPRQAARPGKAPAGDRLAAHAVLRRRLSGRGDRQERRLGHRNPAIDRPPQAAGRLRRARRLPLARGADRRCPRDDQKRRFRKPADPLERSRAGLHGALLRFVRRAGGGELRSLRQSAQFSLHRGTALGDAAPRPDAHRARRARPAGDARFRHQRRLSAGSRDLSEISARPTSTS